MSRNLLHITKLEEFKKYLDEQGIEHRAGRGDYQILQVRKGVQWCCVYERIEMPEHFTTDRRLDQLVSKFCRSRKTEQPSQPKE